MTTSATYQWTCLCFCKGKMDSLGSALVRDKSSNEEPWLVRVPVQRSELTMTFIINSSFGLCAAKKLQKLFIPVSQNQKQCVFFCLTKSQRDISSVIIYNKEKHQLFTFEKLEPPCFWHFYLKCGLFSLS